MYEWSKLTENIAPPDRRAGELAAARWDSLAKPLGSLGLLEEAVVRIAALTGRPQVRLDRRTLLVFCADNGVVARGVTQSDQSITAVVARALAAGESSVCHMARRANCRVIPVDVGMTDFPETAGVLSRRVRNGTADITQGPAMTREECLAAIRVGMNLAEEQRRQGTQLLAAGEMGIGNTTTSAAVAAVLLGKRAEEVVGRGAGLSDAGLERKIAAVGQALEVNRPDGRDPVDVLSKVGGLDLAALCGLYLGAARYRLPAVLDGVISGVAALCAVRMCPQAACALIPGHLSAEPAGRLVLEALGMEPLITARMRLGEGSGAVAAMPLLDMALEVYRAGSTFSDVGMEAYVPQN